MSGDSYKRKKSKIDDVDVEVGPQGQTHAVKRDKQTSLTTQQGIPVSDDLNTLKAGQRGPALIQDFHFREKIFHFDHERIPERVVHARGFGAHGTFELHTSLGQFTTADVLTETKKKTPVFVRFSTVAGARGSFDLARDVRGFAVKFYTSQGNWDLVGNNMPVFFIQDAIRFPDLVHAVKEEPDRGFPQAQSAHDNFWDFASLTPESVHMLMWIMSDRAIPRSLRFMEGFGVHSFRLINAEGRSTYVKFHWKPKLGLQSVVWNEAVKINGADPDFHRRDMWEAITSGQFPEWELGVQLFDDAFAEKFDFDILDATKLIPEELVPVKPIGRMVLDRVVDNFFAETEQVAFMTQNVVPGIGFTNDPLLQGRNFSYLDTQLKRLGSTNFTHLPINAPKCPFHTLQQDGHMAMTNPKGRVNYQPNSWGEGPVEDAARGYQHYPEQVDGGMTHQRGERFADHYSQARQFYISQTSTEQTHIKDAFVFELSKVEKEDIRSRVVAHLLNVDQDLAHGVAQGIGLEKHPQAAVPARPPIEDLPSSDKLSILKNGPKTFAGRKLGVLITDGTDASLLDALIKTAEGEGATIELVAPVVGGVKTSDGKKRSAQQKLNGGPSVLYDAIVLLASSEGAKLLLNEATARDFIMDAWAHAKFIGYCSHCEVLLRRSGIEKNDEDDGFLKLESPIETTQFVEKCRALRFWPREKMTHAI